MGNAAKGCVNENCPFHRRKVVFAETDRFCTRCGKPLSYVCKNCFSPLSDEAESCSRCREKKRAGENFLRGIEGFRLPNPFTVNKIPGQQVRVAGAGVFAIPPEFSRIRKNMPVNVEQSRQAAGYSLTAGTCSGYFLCYELTEEEALPFADPEGLVGKMHERMEEDTGLIEVRAGQTGNDRPFIYVITKHAMKSMTGLSLGTEYLIQANLRLEEGIVNISGSFTSSGIRETRSSEVLTSLMETGRINVEQSGFQSDPYDPDYRRGFLMDQSEKEEFDVLYPDHPLTRLRGFLRFLINWN